MLALPDQMGKHRHHLDAAHPEQRARFAVIFHALQNGRRVELLLCRSFALSLRKPPGIADDPDFLVQLDARCFHYSTCTIRIKASMSVAVALPVLTIKLACLGETMAPPILHPFKPQASIKRATIPLGVAKYRTCVW